MSNFDIRALGGAIVLDIDMDGHLSIPERVTPQDIRDALSLPKVPEHIQAVGKYILATLTATAETPVAAPTMPVLTPEQQRYPTAESLAEQLAYAEFNARGLRCMLALGLAGHGWLGSRGVGAASEGFTAYIYDPDFDVSALPTEFEGIPLDVSLTDGPPPAPVYGDGEVTAQEAEGMHAAQAADSSPSIPSETLTVAGGANTLTVEPPLATDAPTAVEPPAADPVD